MIARDRGASPGAFRKLSMQPDTDDAEDPPPRPSSPPRARTTRSWRQKILLLLALSPIYLIVAELAVRGWLAVRGEAYGATATRERIVEIATTMTAAMPWSGDAAPPPPPATDAAAHILSPYYGWEFESTFESLEAEARRFRAGDLDDAFVVVVIGGSVSVHVAKRGEAAMQEVLRADPRLSGREIVILSQGRGAFKQPQQANLFTYLLAMGITPDALIDIDGLNEMVFSYDNFTLGVHPLHPSWSNWALVAAAQSRSAHQRDLAADIRLVQRAALELEESGFTRLACHSALLGRLALARLQRLESEWGGLQERWVQELSRGDARDPARGPRFEGDAQACIDLTVRCWSESSRSLQGACSARSITYLHVLQPTLHDTGSKPLTPAEIASGQAKWSWIEGVQRGYPLLREAGAQLAASGVAFVDGSRVFEHLEEPIYFDSCHFRNPGLQMFAQLVARELLARLPATIPKLRGKNRSEDAPRSR